VAAFPCAFSIVHLLKSHSLGLLYKILPNFLIELTLEELCCRGVSLCFFNSTPSQNPLTWFTI